MIQIDAVVVGM